VNQHLFDCSRYMKRRYLLSFCPLPSGRQLFHWTHSSFHRPPFKEVLMHLPHFSPPPRSPLFYQDLDLDFSFPSDVAGVDRVFESRSQSPSIGILRVLLWPRLASLLVPLFLSDLDGQKTALQGTALRSSLAVLPPWKPLDFFGPPGCALSRRRVSIQL